MAKTKTKDIDEELADLEAELDDDDLEDIEGLEEDEDEEEEVEEKPKRSRSRKTKAAPAKSKRSRRAKPVEEDDEDEEDEDEEEEKPKRSRSRKSAATKTTKKGSTKSTKGKQPAALTRELPAGKYGAGEIAELAGVDARAVRVFLRKHEDRFPKDEELGRYAFTKKQATQIAKAIKAA